MGAAASVSSSIVVSDQMPVVPVTAIKTVELRKLPDAIEEALYVHEKFPLIIDTTEQAGRFLKYQTGTFISFDDPVQSMKGNINKALVGALHYGRTLTIKFPTLQGVNDSIFQPGVFPRELLNRSLFFTDDVWKSVIPPQPADADEITISSAFVFIICTNTEYIPPELFNVMHIIKVVDKLSGANAGSTGTAGGAAGEETDPMDQIAQLFGAKEVIRFVS